MKKVAFVDFLSLFAQKIEGVFDIARTIDEFNLLRLVRFKAAATRFYLEDVVFDDSLFIGIVVCRFAGICPGFHFNLIVGR